MCQMKKLYALYDCNDNFVDCGFSLNEMQITQNRAWYLRHKSKRFRLCIIPLEPKDDVFFEEDKIFIEENMYDCYKKSELAKIYNCSERAIYRRKVRGVL